MEPTISENFADPFLHFSIKNTIKIKANRGIGCIIGAFCGDALGAPLEFLKKVSGEQIELAMKYQLPGELKLASGQITDDSELSLCLLQGLISVFFNNFF